MKERYGAISKPKNSIFIRKSNEESSFNYYSLNFFNSKHFKEVKEVFSCLKGCILSFKNLAFKLLSKLSFLMQSLVFKIPLLILILIAIGFLHIYLFELLFFNNYYYAIKNQYLKKLTNEIDNKFLELDTLEYQSSFNEVEELLFFNIYFKELVNMGLIDQDSNNKKDVFTTINSQLASIYSNVNVINENLGINNDYILSVDDNNNEFLKSNTILNEFAKIYYYLLPSITVDQNKQETYLNQSFLIAYEYDDALEKIDENNYFYFSYPMSKSLYNSKNNFHPGNTLINPNIYTSNPKNYKFENKNDINEFDNENWFSKQDFLFRNNSKNLNKSIISFEHLNYNYFGKLNKTFITSLQYYFENKNKKYIINIINFFHQINYTKDTMSYSIFLLNNNSNSYKPIINEKYSNNDTFVISQNNITELSMCFILENYFHYGIKDNKNSYYQYGVSFDNFDLNKMSSMDTYYVSLEEYYTDLIFIAPFYLFGKLFQSSDYNTRTISDQDLYIYEFNNEKEIKSICSQFNFKSYIQEVKDYGIDCTNLNYVDLIELNKNDNNNLNLPICACFVLNCLNKSSSSIDAQFKKNNFILTNSMQLPNKCTNYFKYYENMKSNEHNNNIQQIMDKFLDKEELNYINFKNIKINNFPGLSYLFVIAVDNTYLKNILSGLTYKLAKTEIYFIAIICLWLLILLALSVHVTLFEANKISSIIYEFNEKYEKYIYKLEESGIKESIKNTTSENNNFLLKPEKEPLLGTISRTRSLKRFNPNFQNNFNANENLQDSNSMLNELFTMFCNYYKLDPQKVIQSQQNIKEKSKKEIKSDIMKEKNELFELLVKLCFYESKINLNIEYNLYSNSPLIIKFNNSLKKGKIKSINEEKFTRDVIYELLSTENIYDDGIVLNLNFAYISYLNIDEYKSIKNALFNRIDPDRPNVNMKQRLKDDQRKSMMKLLMKNKNVLYNDLQKFYDLDGIKYNKLENCFNQFLLSVYYKYLKKIVESKK